MADHKKNYKRTMNYMRFRLQLSVKQCHRTIRAFAKEQKAEFTRDGGNMNSYFIVCDLIQNNWQKFMDFWGKFKHTFPNNRSKQHRKTKQMSYQEWWDQCNMDGSFAYNGAADDF